MASRLHVRRRHPDRRFNAAAESTPLNPPEAWLILGGVADFPFSLCGAAGTSRTPLDVVNPFDRSVVGSPSSSVKIGATSTPSAVCFDEAETLTVLRLGVSPTLARTLR